MSYDFGVSTTQRELAVSSLPEPWAGFIHGFIIPWEGRIIMTLPFL